MRKSGFLAFLLAIALVLASGQLASADTVNISFLGPYDSGTILGWDIFPNTVPNEFICSTHELNAVSDRSDPPRNIPIEITTNLGYSTARAWLFRAAEDIFDYEFFYTGDLFSDDKQFFDEVVIDNSSGGYLHFIGGTGITEGSYFGIMAYQQDDTTVPPDGIVDFLAFNPADIDIHPTPIPSALLLLGSGFVGLVGFRRFRRN